jgi:hypothetical protein
VFRAQAFSKCHRPLLEGLGVREATLAFKQDYRRSLSDVATCGCRGPAPLEGGDAASVERLGFGMAALLQVEPCEIVKRDADVGVFWPQRFSRIATGACRAAQPRHGAPVCDRARRRLLSTVATMAWSGPSLFSQISSARLKGRSASGLAGLKQVRHRQIVQGITHEDGRARAPSLPDRQRTPVERVGLGMARERTVTCAILPRIVARSTCSGPSAFEDRARTSTGAVSA